MPSSDNSPSAFETPAEPTTPDGQVPARIASVLLLTAVAALCGLVVCAVGWYLAAQRAQQPISSLDLTSEDKQRLVDDMLLVSPGAHRWAYFEPRIAYTLRPDSELEIWNDRFTSNALGYRTGPPEKVPGTYRIVFVGDSWTYGMGVTQEQSFPNLVARWANRYGDVDRPVEAWTLALPGYNLHNSQAALSYFYDSLQPDAVVVVPSGNDNFSSNTVLPNGAQWSDGLQLDEFGEPHQLTYRARRLNSFRFQDRWRQAFTRLRQSEERLQRDGVPSFLFFLARWQEIDVHYRIEEVGLQSPYAIAPLAWTRPPWTNPPPIGHGSAVAQGLYARLLYNGLAPTLGWSPLPKDRALGEFLDPEGTGEALGSEGMPLAEQQAAWRAVDEVSIYQAPPAAPERAAEYLQLLDDVSRDLVSTTFRPPNVEWAQIAGPIEPQTGLLRRAATVLVRPQPGHRFLAINVRPLNDVGFIYPMTLRVTIPSPNGGSQVETTVTAEPVIQQVVLPIPTDLRPGQVLDVVLEADNTTQAPDLLAQRSLYVSAIESLSARP